MKDPWPTRADDNDILEAAMAEAGILFPPPVNPPMPPLRPGDRPIHKGSHVWTFAGESKTQPYTHIWKCERENKHHPPQPCLDTLTRVCTLFRDRFGECTCFEEGEDG